MTSFYALFALLFVAQYLISCWQLFNEHQGPGKVRFGATALVNGHEINETSKFILKHITFLLGVRISPNPKDPKRMKLSGCGGAIIGKNKLVTAAHCLKKAEIGYYAIGQKNPNTNKMRENEDNRFNLKHWTIHPQYSDSNDIAVITLPHNINFNNHVGALELADPDFVLPEKARVFMFGYGGDKVLRYTVFTIVSGANCKRMYGESQFVGVDDRSFYCVPRANTTLNRDNPAYTEDGDSGSPYVIKDKGVYKLIAVHVAGVNGTYGYGGYSSTRKYSIAQSVAYYRKWIVDPKSPWQPPSVLPSTSNLSEEPTLPSAATQSPVNVKSGKKPKPKHSPFSLSDEPEWPTKLSATARGPVKAKSAAHSMQSPSARFPFDDLSEEFHWPSLPSAITRSPFNDKFAIKPMKPLSSSRIKSSVTTRSFGTKTGLGNEDEPQSDHLGGFGSRFGSSFSEDISNFHDYHDRIAKKMDDDMRKMREDMNNMRKGFPFSRM